MTRYKVTNTHSFFDPWVSATTIAKACSSCGCCVSSSCGSVSSSGFSFSTGTTSSGFSCTRFCLLYRNITRMINTAKTWKIFTGYIYIYIYIGIKQKQQYSCQALVTCKNPGSNACQVPEGCHRRASQDLLVWAHLPCFAYSRFHSFNCPSQIQTKSRF